MKKCLQRNLKKRLRSFYAMLFLVLFSGLAMAQLSATTDTRVIPAGSVIINMGVTPQTINNGMRPYGLVYDLVVNKKIPVIWSISPTKVKDGTDFSVDGIDFKGSAFIIEKKWVSLPLVQASFANANFSVVTKHTTTTDVTVPFYKELSAFTTWYFDTQNGDGITYPYLQRAAIPASAYLKRLPSQLTTCIDVFAYPHGDPKWSDDGKLYEWVQAYDATTNPNGNAGYLWAGCHSVDASIGIENMYNTANTAQRTNFLSTASGTTKSVDKQAPSNTASNWQYYYPNDSPMQFMGDVGTVLNTGSGPGYKTINGQSWRPETKIAIVDPSQGTTKIANELLYGYAYGDPANGVVMYEAGHKWDGTNAANVSAMRAFLNFLFDGSSRKNPTMTEVIAQGGAIVIQSGQTINLEVTATGYGGGAITYSWTQQDLSGSFSSTSTSATVYTAETLSAGTTEKSGTITITATDPCGRPNTFTYPVTIQAPGFCTKPGLTGSPNGYTKVGILTKGSITNNTGSIKWPENVPNGHIVMDSSDKGFVITHMNTVQRDALIPLKGMLIYNTDLKCVQLYRGATPGVDSARTGWNCIERGCNE